MYRENPYTDQREDQESGETKRQSCRESVMIPIIGFVV